jgi:hypothetical protein
MRGSGFCSAEAVPRLDPREDDAFRFRVQLASSFAFFPAAIACIVRPVFTEVRYLSVSPVGLPTCSSAIFLSSQFSVFSPRRGLSRIRIHSPFIRSPSRVKWRWPSARVLRGSLPGAGVQVPRSHSITVPPPYSPFGIVPSKVA